MIEDILLQIRKPAQYIGEEWNSPRKDFDKSNIKFLLSFPDLYEIGMSNLGLRILYSVLNAIKDVACERVFAVDKDMEELLRSKNRQISSLESARPIRAFDIIGFSLGYELTYTNVLNILDLGGIPLRASDRDNSYPLVIGGGPCTMNPEPLCDFFDLFVIGEAEEVIIEIVDVCRRFKDKFGKAGIDKQDLLFAFSQIEGVYVPSLYEAVYNEGRLEKFTPRAKGVPPVVKKRFIKDLNSAHFPLDWLVPYIQIVHDRIGLELMRGCPNHCRFCQARQQYSPLRYRDIEQVLDLAQQLYKRTGYEEISLGGLSVSDYPGIEELIKRMTGLFKEKGISIALPSVKPRNMLGNLSSLIAATKKTGLTFAPEAGSQKLRDILGKDFNLDEFFKALEQAYSNGYQHVKLYFMIGLPGEEAADLDAIVDFATKVSELKRAISKSPAQVNISINWLIPKPHTAFQWLGMGDLEMIKEKQEYIRKKLKNRRLKLSFHNKYMSFLEAVFSRGDRRLAGVVYSAFKKGARFDSWSSFFLFERWQACFDEAGINPLVYLRPKPAEQLLPWDFLDTGVNKSRLWDEFKKVVDIK